MTGPPLELKQSGNCPTKKIPSAASVSRREFLGRVSAGTGLLAAGGATPVAITASERPKQRPEFFRDVEEGIEWMMEFAGGGRGDFSTSYNDNLNKFRAEAAKDWIEINPAYSYAGLQAVTHAGPLILVVPPSQQAVQMDDFARCVRDDLATACPAKWAVVTW